jgi:hypothetical protein
MLALPSPQCPLSCYSATWGPHQIPALHSWTFILYKLPPLHPSVVTVENGLRWEGSLLFIVFLQCLEEWPAHSRYPITFGKLSSGWKDEWSTYLRSEGPLLWAPPRINPSLDPPMCSFWKGSVSKNQRVLFREPGQHHQPQPVQEGEGSG